MELNYLHEFVVLAQNCHFQEAAAQLFISQSSLSKHIKAIETELGNELFTRSTRKVELSEFGSAFLPYATRISELQQEYNRKLLNKEDSHRKRIRIGISPLVTLYNMQDLLVDFSKYGPEYEIEIIDLNEVSLQEILNKGRCHLVISQEDSSDAFSEYFSIPYTRDSLVAALSDNHPLAKEPYLTIDQLRGSHFIQLGQANLLQLLDPTCTASYTVSRSNALMQLIARDAGIGIVTQHFAQYLQPADVSIVPIMPETVLQMNIYCLKHQRKNPAIAYILNWFQNKK